MRKMVAALLVGVTMVSGTALAGGTFTLDAKNTKIEFVGSKANGKHEGGFAKVTGTASATGADASTLKLEVDVDTTSLYSDNPKLTQHLKSPDFFAVKSHPKATFVSTKVAKAANGYSVTGDLTLLGKTKSVTFPARITLSDGRLSLASQFEINRQDFGMTFGTGKVNDEVKLKVVVNATK